MLRFGGAFVVVHHDDFTRVVVATHALATGHASQIAAQVCTFLLLAFIFRLVLARLVFGLGGLGPAAAKSLFLLGKAFGDHGASVILGGRGRQGSLPDGPRLGVGGRHVGIMDLAVGVFPAIDALCGRQGSRAG